MNNNYINIFYESYGNNSHPAIVLNAGISNQCIIWDSKFCEDLSAKGYFVIRYDYRDTGLSSKINYDLNPYDMLDITNDVINILKKENINKAYFVGFSMGGQVAQLAAAYHPEFVEKLILITTSTDFRPSFNAFEGIFKIGGLSAPHLSYIMAAISVDFTKHFVGGKIFNYVKSWKLLDASSSTFEKNYFTKQAKLYFARSDYPNSYINHVKAVKASFEIHTKAVALINKQTLIIQGGKDPLFAIDHGRALNNEIANSQLIIWKDFAHAISPKHFERLINTIDDFIKS